MLVQSRFFNNSATNARNTNAKITINTDNTTRYVVESRKETSFTGIASAYCKGTFSESINDIPARTGTANTVKRTNNDNNFFIQDTP